MKTCDTNKILELLTVREAARQLRGCDRTLARKIEEKHIAPDALMFIGYTRRRSPLFAVSRLSELEQLLPR